MNYLGDKTGKTGTTPLVYVIQEDDAVPTAAEITLLATAQHERAIMSMDLAGPSYEADKGRVWELLQELSCEGGAAWSFIAKSSAAQQSRSKQVEYVIIANSTYDGERRHHSFEMFINKLTSAYQDLSDYKEDVAEGKKVRDFLEAIKTPALDAGKAQVIANPNIYGTLESVTKIDVIAVDSSVSCANSDADNAAVQTDTIDIHNNATDADDRIDPVITEGDESIKVFVVQKKRRRQNKRGLADVYIISTYLRYYKT
eukprot:scaffold7120_cov60-Attheya_sp.AAC.2